MHRKRLWGIYMGDAYHTEEGIGNPTITTDSDGDVIDWETTETVNFKGNTNTETDFYINYEEGFELYIKGTFYKATESYGTIINALDITDSSNPAGFCLRKDTNRSLYIQYGNTTKQVSWAFSGVFASSYDFEIKITKPPNSSTATVDYTNDIGTENSFTMNLTFTDKTRVLLGSSVTSDGDYYRYSICDITTFYVKKI